MEGTTIQLIEKRINDDLMLIQTPDPAEFIVHVASDTRYLVHFLNREIVGAEFVLLQKGDNLFRVTRNEETTCYLFDETQLRNVVTGVEPGLIKRMMASTQTVTAGPCTGPIVIPPKWNDNN